jgi:hypothetical protein
LTKQQASSPREHGRNMDKTYLIRFKTPALRPQIVIAASAEIQGEHLILLNSRGKLAALFLLEIVESWTETECA